MTYDQSQLAYSIREAIENDRDDVVDILAKHIIASACEITTDDDDADDLAGDGGAMWVTSTHTLTIDGVEVAEWTRCAIGRYGDQGRTEMVGVWCVDEDTDGGDELPEIVASLLGAIGMDDAIPDVPEPAEPNHPVDPDGEYCVYWETVGDDAGPLHRYATQEEAEEMCEVYSRHFRAANPSGGGVTMLCGHSVRQLIDGRWR